MLLLLFDAHTVQNFSLKDVSDADGGVGWTGVVLTDLGTADPSKVCGAAAGGG